MNILALHYVEALAELTHHRPVLFIHKNDVTVSAASNARAYIAFAWGIIGWIVALFIAAGWACAFQECRTLRKNGLKGIDIFLRHSVRTGPNLGEFNAGERSWQIKAWYEVAAWWLMIYLNGRGQRDVELRREVQVQVEVFFGCRAGRLGRRQVGEGGGRGHHQQGQCLRSRMTERRLLAILYVVGIDVAYAVEQLWVIVACRHNFVSCVGGMKVMRQQ